MYKFLEVFFQIEFLAAISSSRSDHVTQFVRSCVRSFMSVGKDKSLDKQIILVRSVEIMELLSKHESYLYG